MSSWLLGHTIGGVTGADPNSLSPHLGHQVASLCLTLALSFGEAGHAQVSHYSYNIIILDYPITLSCTFISITCPAGNQGINQNVILYSIKECI